MYGKFRDVLLVCGNGEQPHRGIVVEVANSDDDSRGPRQRGHAVIEGCDDQVVHGASLSIDGFSVDQNGTIRSDTKGVGCVVCFRTVSRDLWEQAFRFLSFKGFQVFSSTTQRRKFIEAKETDVNNN